jgi:hypothetical protein
MTPTQPSAAPRFTKPVGRPRRVKRGIVAAYIHEISARHRDAAATIPATTTTPEPLPTARFSARV